MDSRTAEYYASRVKDAAELYNSAKTGGAGKYFASSFPSGSSVLDIGCGSGRDYKKYPARFANEKVRFMGGSASFISDDSTELITSPLNERIKNSMEYLSAMFEAVEIIAI